MNSRLKLLRKIFLIVFILTGLIAAYLLFFSRSYSGMPGVPPPTSSVDSLGFFVTVSTATISLLGFLITTTLSFRREKRDARESALAIKQKEIELERARLELEQLKKQVKKKKK